MLTKTSIQSQNLKITKGVYKIEYVHNYFSQLEVQADKIEKWKITIIVQIKNFTNLYNRIKNIIQNSASIDDK